MSGIYQQLQQTLILNPKTWLITGVAGFIGSHLLDKLLVLNQKVIGLDNFATGSPQNLEAVLAKYPSLKNNFIFYQGDICSLSDCKLVIKDVDFVLHQAALGSVPRSIKTPLSTHDTNSTGFLNMLLAASEANIQRFVFASSSSVYGDAEDLPKKESLIGSPLSPYAVSKMSNELYAQVFTRCYGIETIGLRYFNVFGPRQDPNGPYAAVIPKWLQAIGNNQTVIIHGDGETTRDFCYVENAVQANLLAATCQEEAATNQIYNIAYGEQNSLKKLYQLIIDTLQPARINVEYHGFRPGDIRHSLADISKAQQLLGYQPTHSLAEGLKEMIDWYLNNLAMPDRRMEKRREINCV